MATFNFKPLFQYQVVNKYNILESQFETGRIQRRYKGPLPREWILGFRDLKSTIKDIENFYIARKGGYESFYWTPAGEDGTIVVRFKDSSCSFTYGGDIYGECELTIQEVLV